MKLKDVVAHAIDKKKFSSLPAYIEFCKIYLDYVEEHLQAVIVSQNENHYCFYQYDKTGNFQITRPINSKLMYNAKTFSKAGKEFLEILKATGVNAVSGTVQVPVVVDGQEQFKMNYQHDLIVKRDDEIKVIGSIKTSSKDRIDKIFVDKFLYSRLTETSIPHIAIFLNDVQRKKNKKENEYGISSTFLPGHFKAYTVKLNPLDGVYYCDIRPNMPIDLILKDHIKTFDHLLIEDIWKFI